jgi:hypothetical protein
MAFFQNAVFQFRIAFLQSVCKVDAGDPSADDDDVVIHVLLLCIHRDSFVFPAIRKYSSAALTNPMNLKGLSGVQCHLSGDVLVDPSTQRKVYLRKCRKTSKDLAS